MNPGEFFNNSMIGPLRVIVSLVNRQVGQGSYKLGRFVGRPLMSTFISIRFILAIYTLPER